MFFNEEMQKFQHEIEKNLKDSLFPKNPNKTKLKMSEAKKGKRSNRAGTIVTEETRKRLSAALKGRPKSEETKEKFRNRKHSAETKLKLSHALLGKKRGTYKKKEELDK